MNTILVLMDSLNRHMLRAYNPDAWVETPNIDRLAGRSVVFDGHWLGSAPCMPARRDILTGRLNFLERNWGGIEPFDVTLPEVLRGQGVFTHMITDHYHYFEIGGENYCQQFSTWDFQRGQESDPWVSRIKVPSLPGEYYGQVRPQYELNRTRFLKEQDYPGPRTFGAACRWLEDNAGAGDFLLMVESFDPHEPFDCPDDYRRMYYDTYEGPHYNWTKYAPVDEPPEATEHLRKCYAGTLTMIDRWLGKLLDTLDRLGLWEDTLLIFLSDHGHMLGEHRYMGKNYMHVYNELARLPFMVHLPGGRGAGSRIHALTQNIDLMPTILDYYGIPCPDSVRGRSLRPILEGGAERIRDTALYGYHGMAVNITDGEHTYLRAPAGADNDPCYIYTAMPATLRRYLGKDRIREMDAGRFLPWTDYPVFRIPTTRAGALCGSIRHVRDSLLFDIRRDDAQRHPLKDPGMESVMEEKLVKAMDRAQAPREQYERLGLAT